MELFSFKKGCVIAVEEEFSRVGIGILRWPFKIGPYWP
jgi:hypothetical protein